MGRGRWFQVHPTAWSARQGACKTTGDPGDTDGTCRSEASGEFLRLEGDGRGTPHRGCHGGVLYKLRGATSSSGPLACETLRTRLAVFTSGSQGSGGTRPCCAATVLTCHRSAGAKHAMHAARSQEALPPKRPRCEVLALTRCFKKERRWRKCQFVCSAQHRKREGAYPCFVQVPCDTCRSFLWRLHKTKDEKRSKK